MTTRGLSALSTSFRERGTQLAYAEGTRLSEVEGTPLTPLPNAPTYENPQLKTALTLWPDGQVEGTLALGTPSRGGVIPKTYLVYVAAFDAKETLVSTAQTELPGVGGTASVKLGLTPMAQHYQLALFAKPTPPKDEMVIAGALVRHLAGEVLPSSTSQITLHEPHFYESNYYKTLSANLSVSTVNLGDAAGYTVHGALFDEKGALLSTDQAPLKPPKVILGRPVQAEYSQEVSLGFGITGRHAVRYQLAVTAPTPKAKNSRLEQQRVVQLQVTPATIGRGLSAQPQESLALEPQTARGEIALSRNTFNANLSLSSLSTLSEAPAKAPDVRFAVASIKTEEDGSLLLLPPPCPYSMEEIFKNPKLRDYTQVKVTSSVVAALKAKGITEFVGKVVQANGKSESVLCLSRPAFEVTTVTVEKAEDIQIGLPLVLRPQEPPRFSARPRLTTGLVELREPHAETLIRQGQAQDFLRRLREEKDGQGRYPLLISPEFNETLQAAAERGDEATVIELVQWSWFGGPQEAAQGGNGVTWAAYCPTLAPVKALLERGVPAGDADASGNTGLHRTYRREIAELLLQHKAPTETKNANGETPLLAQTRQVDRWLGRVGVVQALLAAKANPNATDSHGRTPLMWAAKSGLPDLVELLLKNGADSKRKDKDGKTAHNYIAAWEWGRVPGFLTLERGTQLLHDSEADRKRVEQLLKGK